MQAAAGERLDKDNIHIGPGDYVPRQKDNKVCFVRMEGKLFGTEEYISRPIPKSKSAAKNSETNPDKKLPTVA